MNPTDWPLPLLAPAATVGAVALIWAGRWWMRAMASLVWLALLRPWLIAIGLAVALAASSAASLAVASGHRRLLVILCLAPILAVLTADLLALLVALIKKQPRPPMSAVRPFYYVFDLERIRLGEAYHKQRSEA